MHVIYVGYGYDARFRSEAGFLESCPTIGAYTRALKAAGSGVTVVQRFSNDGSESIDGVRSLFLRDGLPERVRWQIPWRLHRAICELAGSVPDTVVHVNGLIFAPQIYALRRQLPRSVPIIVQHHAERPSAGWKRTFQKYGLRSADAFLFTSSALAAGWVASGVISSEQPVYEVMESPVTLDVSTARSAALRGTPALLWVGRLNAGKDPLTVLAAFEIALRKVPSARLYLVHTGGELLDATREKIAASETLRSSVEMVGAVAHRDLSRMYAVADFFVSGSHHEGSGYALAEAMAHGAIPIVPRIASFMTMAHSAARFWSPGEVADCARAMIEAMSEPLAPQRERVRRQYREFLSAEAIARHAIAAYGEVIQRRRKSA